MTFRPIVSLCIALALVACATPTAYAPATGGARQGFSDYRIEAGRYRITFTGGAGAPISQVADYALRRAAEIALRDGYDWFRIVDRVDSRAGSSGGPRVSLGTGTSSWGRRSSIGIGVGTSFDLSGGPAWSRTIEILAGEGAAPREGDVYNARNVLNAGPPPP